MKQIKTTIQLIVLKYSRNIISILQLADPLIPIMVLTLQQLKKETRSSFIPSNDIFVEMDISAYHPTLAAQLIGYDFGDKDIHASFAEMYGVDYKTAKELTFKQLYGGVFKEYAHLEYFKKIQMFMDDAWNMMQQEGYYDCPISKYRYQLKNLDNMNPNKLFNYILQNMETSNNMNILMDIHKLLIGRKTKNCTLHL